MREIRLHFMSVFFKQHFLLIAEHAKHLSFVAGGGFCLTPDVVMHYQRHMAIVRIDAVKSDTSVTCPRWSSVVIGAVSKPHRLIRIHRFDVVLGELESEERRAKQANQK